MEGTTQFFEMLKLEQLSIIVLIAFAMIILMYIVLLVTQHALRKQKRAMALLVSLLDEDTENEITEYLKTQKNAEENLKNGPIAEYNKACSEIRKRYGAEKQRISGYYDAEIRRVSSEYSRLKSEANRMGNASLMNQYQFKSNHETQALTAKKKAELAPIQNAETSELENLREEYQDELDYYKNIKKLNKNISCLSTAFENAKKQKVELPALDD